jgi:hypothetical protein
VHNHTCFSLHVCNNGGIWKEGIVLRGVGNGKGGGGHYFRSMFQEEGNKVLGSNVGGN